MKPETKVWQWLCSGMDPHWEATRIENTAGSGVPDVGFVLDSFPGVWVWLELKCNTARSVSSLRASQDAFFATYARRTPCLLGVMHTDEVFYLIDARHRPRGPLKFTSEYLKTAPCIARVDRRMGGFAKFSVAMRTHLSTAFPSLRR